MDRAFPIPQFFQHFDPANWEEEVCADLAPVLRLLLTDPDNCIAAMGLENIKAPDLAVLLNRPPAAGQLAQIDRLCADNPNLRAHPGSIVCRLHYSSLDWKPAGPAGLPKTSFLQRFFGKRHAR